MKTTAVISGFLSLALPTAIAVAQPGAEPAPAPQPDPTVQAPGMQAAAPSLPTHRTRHGATFGVGVGMASLTSGQDKSDALNGRFFVGGWITNTTALIFDASSYAIDENNSRGTSGAFTVYGLGLQHYLTDRTWVSGAMGSALVTTPNGDSENVFSLVGRGGYNIFENGPHALSLTLELAAGFFQPETLTGFSAGIGYQMQ
jgi:hypothetical protein